MEFRERDAVDYLLVGVLAGQPLCAYMLVGLLLGIAILVALVELLNVRHA